MGGITPSGKLYTRIHFRSLRGPQAAQFLSHLLRQIPGLLLVIWDGAPIHRSQAVKALLASEVGQRLCLEQLPAYAPDLNPSEGVWSHLKCVELRNLICDDLFQLRRELRAAIQRLRRRPDLIVACFAGAGLPL